MTWEYKLRRVLREVALLVFWLLSSQERRPRRERRGRGLFPKGWFDR